MDVKEIEPGFTVSGQIMPSDLQTLADKGIKTIINHRPDGEEAGQPRAEDLARAAQALGMTWVEAPIIAKQPPEERVVQTVKTVLRQGEKPVHAYCKTGMRAAMAWAFAYAEETSPDDLILAARKAGYELEHLRPWFEHD